MQPMLRRQLTFEGEFDLNGILGKAKSAAAREDVSIPTAPGSVTRKSGGYLAG